MFSEMAMTLIAHLPKRPKPPHAMIVAARASVVSTGTNTLRHAACLARAVALILERAKSTHASLPHQGTLRRLRRARDAGGSTWRRGPLHAWAAWFRCGCRRAAHRFRFVLGAANPTYPTRPRACLAAEEIGCKLLVFLALGRRCNGHGPCWLMHRGRRFRALAGLASVSRGGVV